MQQQQPHRRNNNWFKLTLSACAIVFCGILAWAIITKMDDTMFYILAGVVVTLIIAVVMAVVITVPAYVINRRRQLDQMEDARTWSIFAGRQRLMPPNLTVDMRGNPIQQPGQQYPLPPGQAYPPVEGQYRDATAPIEIE